MSKKREVRVFELRKQELRAEENEGKKYIVGYMPYNQLSEDLGCFQEVLRKGCFTKTILENRIYALINHNSDKCLGNSKSGTLTFEDTEDFLKCKIEINENVSFAKDLYECVKRNDVVGLSFGFSAIKENWDNENNIREIKEAKLYEISFGVVFPAYQTATSFVEARSIINTIDNLPDDEQYLVLNQIKKRYFYELPETSETQEKQETRETTETQQTNNTQDNTTTHDTVSQESTQSGNGGNIDLYYYRLKVLQLTK